MLIESSSATESDWKHPWAPAYQYVYLTVGAGKTEHKIYCHQYGNPDGVPVLFLHGGPGGGTTSDDVRYFNPDFYRVILFDQRGCGQSLPHVRDDPVAGLAANETSHLISDIDCIRESLGIEGKMLLFGGSWGATLALAYAIARPDNVASLVLRGIFLCRKRDLDFLYQGNASTYDPTDPYALGPPGAYILYPEAWREFVEMIDPIDRHDMIAAYAAIFSNPTHNKIDHAVRTWSVWEGLVSYRSPGDNWREFGDPEFAKAFSMIENHYFMNGGFLGTTPDRNNNYILENVGKIKHLPIHIVQGRFDQVCPRFQADELVYQLRKAGAVRVNYILTDAGHSANERANRLKLTAIMDALSALGNAGW